MKKILFLICSSSAILFMTACSTCKPVLYSNNHYKRVGRKQAEKDIQDRNQDGKDARTR